MSIVTLSLALSACSLPCLPFGNDSESLLAVPLTVVTARGERFNTSYSSLQEAINQAENGSTIHVPPGTYYEHVLVNKSISLFGDENLTTVVDGSGTGSIVNVTANDVTIAFLKLQNSGYGWYRHGVYVDTADNCTIRNNLFTNNCHTVKLNYSRNSRISDNRINGTMASPTMYGIRVENSTNCIVTGNDVADCVGAIHLQNATHCEVRSNRIHENSQGIRFYSPCTFNEVAKNIMFDNTYDGMVSTMPGNSTFFSNRISHNNFINNTYPFIIEAAGFSWDSGYPSGGNYWSRYNGTDTSRGPFQNETGNDGIGDVQYVISGTNVDRYPLVQEWSTLPVHNIDEGTSYNQIQEALDAPETSTGNTIFADKGVYREHLILIKSVSLIGENQESTIIDGENSGTVITVEAENVTFAGFTVRNSGSLFPPYGNDCGVLLHRCVGANVRHNTVINSQIGTYLYYSRDNTIEHNTINSNREDGLLLWHSGSNILVNNSMFDNPRNFGVFGQEFTHFNNIVNRSNTVNGKPVYYLIEARDDALENRMDVGVVYLINCTNMTIRNLELSNNSHGVLCFNTTDSRIENVTSSRNGYGVVLQDSVNCYAANNRCSKDWVGLLLEDSRNNCLDNNTVDGGEKGISVYEADNNTICGNTIMNAFFGIRVYASDFNLVFHNNLIGNAEQINIVPMSHKNAWDNGIEGNYWSEYAAKDDDRDGLGDDLRAIDSQNYDAHPLLGRFHSLAVTKNEILHKFDVMTNSTILGLIFEEQSSVIRLTVDGPNATFGFCRVRVPHAFIAPELAVEIDGDATQVLHANYTIFDDGSSRWIYFAYLHSTREITIIPEFHSWILLLFAFLTLVILQPRKASPLYCRISMHV